MKKFIFVLSSLLFLVMAQAQTVSVDDFKPLSGTWKGQLSYLDYTSNTRESISAACTVTIKDSNGFELDFRYPGESGKGGADLYTITANGSRLNGMKVLERTEKTGGSLSILLEEKGPDGNDNRAATFHFIIEIAKNKFVITKLVKFDGEKDFFQRNQYVFSRS